MGFAVHHRAKKPHITGTMLLRNIENAVSFFWISLSSVVLFVRLLSFFAVLMPRSAMVSSHQSSVVFSTLPKAFRFRSVAII